MGNKIKGMRSIIEMTVVELEDEVGIYSVKQVRKLLNSSNKIKEDDSVIIEDGLCRVVRYRMETEEEHVKRLEYEELMKNFKL